MTSKRELRETFDHYDGDGNGLIDKDEFCKLMRTLHDDPEEPIDDAELELGFSEIDGDGNGTIEFDEFAAWWRDRWS